MTGIILDAVLMLLLVVAIGYGVRLERKLVSLRAGQLAFAGAVTELNTAAGRAEAALASLRASGQETDLLHDRILKARAIKQELEVLIARAPVRETVSAPVPVPAAPAAPVSVAPAAEDDGGHARRMASLLERINGVAGEVKPKPEAARTFAPVFQALAANQAAQQSLNRARRSLDEDLFAA
ncbi:DUF6468 domain-containing protein [uncultured Brevundimonas sp.]|mgnify:CR=1 FL=1|uniref:DUF6468 domain-containing protein n=1 Tax=uncultured Brevundimonas sp. TaxID=213418 RepID=UPI0030ECC73B|tara:strand:- start:26489 stop:27034 length:546 start_codon:yes stop_codon:yes gene_type:complete